MKRLRILRITLILCLFSLVIKAQTKVVQGVIKDQLGPIPGCSVIEKGFTNNGVASDENGKFKITLKGSSGVLIVRTIGYDTKEIAIGNKTDITITLQSSSQALDEVVVVGFGQQPKLTLTGSQSVVSGTNIRQNPSASLQNTLAGRVTGLTVQQRSGQPGSDGAAFYIRGQSSYTGNNNPLIIVDDVEYSFDRFSSLDANEVESITLLKDASQTAVYGIKGANGVLVVTTRRGQIGKPSIGFRTDYSLSQPTILPDHLDAYNTALLYNQAQINDNKYSASPVTNFQPSWTANDLALFQNGQDPYGHPNVNWKKELFRTFAPQYKATFDVNGGTEKARYFVSIGYLNQGGITKHFSDETGVNNNFYTTRYNYRSNLDINVNKTLSLRIDAYGSINQTNAPSLSGYNDIMYEYGSFLALSPYSYPVKNPDGSWGYTAYQRSQTSLYTTGNIIERLALGGYARSNQNNMVLTTSATQKLNFITQGLSAKGTVAYTSNYSNSSVLNRTNFPSYIYTQATNTYELKDPNVSRLQKLTPGYTAGSTERRLTAQGFLTYDRTFGKHNVTALALYSLTSNTARSDDANYNFIPNNTLGSTARVHYDYNKKYVIEVSGAYNGTNRFTGAKRFGLFPAGSAAYIISEEPFFKNTVKFIDLLKLRGSYGIVGTDAIGGFSYAYLQSYSNNNGNQQASFGTTAGTLPVNQGIQEGTLSNQNVTWEKQKELNLAVDFAALKSSLSGTVEVFNNNRYDILTTRGTVSAIFGQGLPPVNLGKVNNRGVEVELNYQNIIGKNFRYNFRATYSYVKNKIVFQDEPDTQYPWQRFTGHPIGARGFYQYIGFYKDMDDVKNSPQPATPARPGDLKYQDVNGDNIIDSRDQIVSDQSNLPTTNYGFQTGFSYKNFSVSVLFQAATGFYVRGYEEAIRAFSSNLSAIHLQSWTPELGDNAKYPLISLSRGVSDPGSYISNFWAISGDYLRLRTAEVSYTLPLKFTNKIGLQSTRIYVSGNNLATWSELYKLYKFDPEYNSGSDRQSYPPQRIYNLGLSITFK